MSNWTTKFVSGVGEIGKPALIASLLLGSGAAQGNIVYVNGAVATSGNGSSWGSAYKYLRDALEHSSGGDPIYVAKGTYYPDDGSTGNFGDRELSFEMNGQKIYGGFTGHETSLGQRNPQLNPTILSGAIWQGAGEDPYWSLHVVYLEQNSTLDGVTVENGHANGADSWNYPSIASDDEGGGCYVKAGKILTLSGCTFRGNRALSYGGAIMVGDSTGKVIATNCLFERNEVPLEYSITTSVPEGGAIKGNVQATNCRFVANKVAASNYIGGTISTGAGGAISGNVTATGCKFIGNGVSAIGYDSAVKSEASGGAISGNVIASQCDFSENESAAIIDTGVSSGGAISGGSVVAMNCSFSKNKSGTGTIDKAKGTGKGGGGAIYISKGNSTLANCVFVKNTSKVRGGAIHQETRDSALTVANCTFLDNGVATGFKGAVLSCGGITRILDDIFWWTSSSVGGFDQDNLIHVIDQGVLRNSNVNYPTPASIAPNIMKGGANGVTVDPGGNVLIVSYWNMLIDADPLFTDALDPDGADNDWGTVDDGLRISAGSPAIVTSRDPRIVGVVNLLPKDSGDIDVDGDLTELLPLDYAGVLRVQKTFVDIGAYEFGNIVQSPEIAIAESGVSGLLLDGGSRSYGSVAKGTSRKKTFIIKNVGTKLLKDISFALSGSTMFVVNKPAATSLKPGATMTFTVRFTPTSKGKKISTLLVSSNDADENPFNINLSGTGILNAASKKSTTTFAAAALASTAFTLASSDDRPSDAAITTTTLSDGSKYLILTVRKSAEWSLNKHTVEVSSNLLDWFSGSNYTTTLLNSSTVLSVRDNAPLIQGEKRYMRLK
ncbi:MAG: hypothetical protein ABI162_14535 [Luteolibacter sp.]